MKVGVIGVGVMGEHHTRVYSEIENVCLVGISDLNESKITKLAEQYNTKAYTDHKELLKEELDAVSIAVPTSLHKDVALDAINYGIKSILIEKPIADTLENAEIIIKAAEDAG
ncbi:MAG: Gfo/Idh/MocA family oxidoreductase, partial [Halobacteriota archaeon]|nr:Gfo/Idh/MocA family oxidoreductase [Halobacteriota archaeon]